MRRYQILNLILFIILMPLVINAQDAPKQEDAGRKTSTTADAWRNALPQNEKQSIYEDESGADADVLAASEKRLTGLEYKLMDAVKLHDAAALKRLLAEDFTLAGTSVSETFFDKTQYINQTVNELKLDSYEFDKISVRLYGNTAIVNARYKQQANFAGKDYSGDFLFTDVWVREGKYWHIVSRHLSQLTESKPK